MSVHMVNTHEAKSRLSELIREAEHGTDVIVARNGQPVAKIIPWPPKRPARVAGTWSGRVSYATDPVGSDDEVADLFEESGARGPAVRLLIDSHVALWWLADDDALGRDCRAQLGSADEVCFSAVTPWELGIKKALGKLEFPDGLVRELSAAGFLELAISAAHAEAAPSLPPHHRDPFDRMLVAQAQLESLALVTADRSLDPYNVEIVDARR